MLKMIAHRGNGKHNYKENTKESLDYSLNQDYIDGIEFDIRYTKDNKIIIFHDMIITKQDRCIEFVNKMTYKSLKKYNIGTKANPSKIMLLDKYLKTIKTKKKIIIEIKWELGNYTKYIEDIHKIVSKYTNLNIYLMSFNYDLLNDYKNKYSKEKLILLIGIVINNNRLINNLDINAYNSYLISKINYDKELMIWNIRNKKTLKKIPNTLFDIDIITDKSYQFTH